MRPFQLLRPPSRRGGRGRSQWKERAAHAMADPEIQYILQDPMINQVLRDFNENPNAANKAMSDPNIRAKIEKLIAAGIIQTG